MSPDLDLAEQVARLHALADALGRAAYAEQPNRSDDMGERAFRLLHGAAQARKLASFLDVLMGDDP